VVSIIALVIAASGTAVAARTLVNGDSLIKQNSLSGNRLRNHSVAGSKIKLKSLGQVPRASRADLATSAINATQASTAVNAANATQATNATTALSADAAPISKVTNVSVKVTVGPANQPSGVLGTASCPAGTVVIGGGASAGDPDFSVVTQMYPVGHTGWRALFFDGHQSTTGDITAICAPAAATAP
jgi:hypothetical protein